LLGYVVWQGSRLYLRRRVHVPTGKVLAATLAGLAIGGAAIAQRQRSPR
jgi:hypothetical protein